MNPHKIVNIIFGALLSTIAIGATYNYFSPGTDLSGTWNSQTVIQAPNLTGAISMTTAATTTSAGRALTITAGIGGSTSGTGGALNLNGGAGQASSSGGGVTITAGAPGATAGNGGTVTIRGGLPTANGNGGAVTIQGRGGFGTGSGGALSVSSGAGGATSGNGGAITFTSGAGQGTGTGGNATLTAGQGGATSGNGGTFILAGGSAPTNGLGGSLTLSGGSSPVTGTAGTVNLIAGAGSAAASDGIIVLRTGRAVNAFQTDVNANIITVAAPADQGFSRQTPANAFSITIPDNTQTLLLSPSCAPCATGTITLPAAPINGQMVQVSTDQAITTLTFSPNTGQTVVAAPATLAVGGSVKYMYCSINTQWYKLQ